MNHNEAEVRCAMSRISVEAGWEMSGCGSQVGCAANCLDIQDCGKGLLACSESTKIAGMRGKALGF